MKRFALSAASVLLAAAALASTAQAAPQIDSAFDLQTLRLSEFDARNKSEEASQPYYSQISYPQTSTEATPQTVSADQDSLPMVESAVWETTEIQEEESSLSLTERRQQSLDRS